MVEKNYVSVDYRSALGGGSPSPRATGSIILDATTVITNPVDVAKLPNNVFPLSDHQKVEIVGLFSEKAAQGAPATQPLQNAFRGSMFSAFGVAGNEVTVVDNAKKTSLGIPGVMIADTIAAQAVLADENGASSRMAESLKKFTATGRAINALSTSQEVPSMVILGKDGKASSVIVGTLETNKSMFSAKQEFQATKVYPVTPEGLGQPIAVAGSFAVNKKGEPDHTEFRKFVESLPADAAGSKKTAVGKPSIPVEVPVNLPANAKSTGLQPQ